jgi:hypothetical protein
LKTCTKCGETKPVEEFRRRSSGSTDGRVSWCRACHRAYEQARQAPGGKDRARRDARRAARYREFRAWLWERKSGPCTDCGSRYHPAAMQFDHLPGTEKCFEVSMSSAQRSRESVVAELAKCELVCANCHALRTYDRLYEEGITL